MYRSTYENGYSDSEGDESAGEGLTDCEFLYQYLKAVEETPDDIARLVSRVKECEAETEKLTRQLDSLTQEPVTSGTVDRVKVVLEEMNEINDQKLDYAKKINEIVHQSYSKVEAVRNPKAVEPSPGPVRPKLRLNPTRCNVRKDSVLNVARKGKAPTKDPMKLAKENETLNETRGRKRQVPFQYSPHASIKPSTSASLVQERQKIKQKTQADNTGINFLADVCLKAEGKKNEDKETKTLAKIPVTKRSGPAKTRKRRQAKVKLEPEPNSEEIEIPDPIREADENEPVYCICNKISYGKMVQCDNEACPLEWFHFNCVDVKSAPKGKWYCPKCRSKKPNQIKKGLDS